MMDSSGFEALFKQQYAVLCRYALLLTGDRATAEDIVQDQFAYLWENRKRLKIGSYERYLFRAVKNKAINYHKSLKNRNKQGISKHHQNIQESNQTDQNIEFKELQDLIQKALEMLPERCYTVFYLKRFEEMSYKEIAGKLFISEKTVENQMNIAIRKIAGYISKFIE
jgi:RNA polymerase sigma-70 factor, ECF subfamily